MTKIDSLKIKDAYLSAGGTEDAWQANKDQMIEGARQQQAINQAVADTNKPPTLNDLMRNAFKDNDSGFARISISNPEGEAA